MRSGLNQVQGRTALIDPMPDRKPDIERSRELVCALQHPDCFNHPVDSISTLETHISWVILTGSYAYKIKKPVDFGFVDFSTLEKRKFYCEEELRLNRRFSTDLYLDMVAIRGSHFAPSLAGSGEAIEYAVKMREFSQRCLLSHLADKYQLRSEHIDSMATEIANMHRRIPVASFESGYGSGQSIEKWTEENFQQIANTLPREKLPVFFDDLLHWSRKTFNRLQERFDARRRGGFIRECHGDLHLANLVYLDERCIAFDCIEFNDELRWIDTISEVAFVVMDLRARDHEAFCWRFLNHYLTITGDYSGLALIAYYVVYRAMVRAKVAALTLTSEGRMEAFSNYLQLARSWSSQKQPVLIVMHGLSGSGKSTVAEDLAGRLGSIHIRSDVERKRLYGLGAEESSGSSVEAGIYTSDASERTYARLKAMAQEILSYGFHVIVDAACLKFEQRNLFRQLAFDLKLPCFLISCEAAEQELRKRITRRLAQADDASEADLDVLAQQLKSHQPLTDEELRNSNTLICRQSRLGDDQIKSILSV